MQIKSRPTRRRHTCCYPQNQQIIGVKLSECSCCSPFVVKPDEDFVTILFTMTFTLLLVIQLLFTVGITLMSTNLITPKEKIILLSELVCCVDYHKLYN